MMYGGGGGGFMGGRMMGRRMGLDQDDEGGQLYDHKVVVRLFDYLKPHWALLLLTIGAMFVYTATVVAIPWLVHRIIDDYIPAGDLSGINWIVALFVAVAAIQFGANYVHLRVMAFVGARVLYTLRVKLFRHIHRLSMSFFDRSEVGMTMSRVQNDVQQIQDFLSVVVLTLADVVSFVGIITVMMLMDFQLALITLTVIPLLFLMLAVWQQYARRSFMRVRRAIAVVNSGLQENISGVRVVQSLNREDANIKQFGSANRENLGANLEATRYTAVLMPSVEVLSALGLALVVFFGGRMVLDGSLEVGVLVAFALYIQRFFEPVRNLTMQYGSLQRAMASGARIFEMLDLHPDFEDKPDAVHVDRVRGDVRYQGVGFFYEPDVPVLQGVDLEARAGETVALVGPTGAGKTTLVSLLLRFYDVTEGRITLDGHDVRDLSQDSLGRQMSVVLQEPYLFSGTVRENIRYNREDATDEEVESAARAVGAHEFIERLSDGYDTELQERGGNLSVGQRQLISFARALVADPRVLILDEATANIDTQTEMRIQRALGELLRDRTALVIAHRLSTVRNADRIVVLEDGRKVEEGSHDELMALDGLYARLHSYSFESNGARETTIDGVWNVTINSPRGTQQGTLELTARGSSFGGVWEGPRGRREFDGGRFDQGNLEWEIEMSGPRGTMTLSFSGMLTGDQIAGQVRFGSFGEGSFVAVRARGQAKPDHAEDAD